MNNFVICDQGVNVDQLKLGKPSVSVPFHQSCLHIFGDFESCHDGLGKRQCISVGSRFDQGELGSLCREYDLSDEYDLYDFSVSLKKCEGSFIVFVVGEETVSLFGDIFGSMPIYFSCLDKKIKASSIPDVVGLINGFGHDLVSFQDYHVTRRICFPHTFYESVKQLSPLNILNYLGSSYSQTDIDFRKIVEIDNDPSVIYDKAKYSLESQVKIACQKAFLESRKSSKGELVISLSAGKDSRILLGLARREVKGDFLRAFTIFEKQCKDNVMAKKLCEKIDLRHDSIHMPSIKYDTLGLSLVNNLGSQNVTKEAHFAPLFKINYISNDVLLSGYGSNTVFGKYERVVDLEKKIKKISADKVLKRWSEFKSYISNALFISPDYLAASWPCTMKKAYMHCQGDRFASKYAFHPFMTNMSIFSIKSIFSSGGSVDFVQRIFNELSGEVGLGVNGFEDEYAKLPEAGWPTKGGIFKGVFSHVDYPLKPSVYPSSFLVAVRIWGGDSLLKNYIETISD